MNVKMYKSHHSTFMTSTGGDVSHCEYHQEHCQLRNNGVAVWKAVKSEQCLYIYHSTINGTTTKSHFLSDDHTLSLTYDNKTFNDCTHLKRSVQGLVFKIQYKEPPKQLLSKFNHTSNAISSKRQHKRSTSKANPAIFTASFNIRPRQPKGFVPLHTFPAHRKVYMMHTEYYEGSILSKRDPTLALIRVNANKSSSLVYKTDTVYDAHFTSVRVILLLADKHHSNTISLSTPNTVMTTSTDISGFFQAELQAVAEYAQIAAHRVFKHAVITACTSQNTMISTFIASLLSQTTLTARKLLKSNIHLCANVERYA